MNYEEQKAKFEAHGYKPQAVERRLAIWLEENPDMAPKAKPAPKVAKEEKKEVEEADEE